MRSERISLLPPKTLLFDFNEVEVVDKNLCLYILIISVIKRCHIPKNRNQRTAPSFMEVLFFDWKVILSLLRRYGEVEVRRFCPALDNRLVLFVGCGSSPPTSVSKSLGF